MLHSTAPTAPTDTIAAIATPNGDGGIGIIRLSGGDLSPLRPLFPTNTLPPPRHAHYTPFLDENQHTIDSGIAIHFPAPHSFTGQSVLELNAHGGYFILKQLLHRCFQLGARQAQGGEFTLRAYLNNKIDLLQAEAIADLIVAKSSAAALAASQSLQGEFSKAVAKFQQHLITVRVAIESSLDFSEDDADTQEPAQATSHIAALQQHATNLNQQITQGITLTRGLKAVIVGAPNVGKSSLFNQLCRAPAAIVSDTPGTTRDILEQHVRLDNLNLSLIDGAGIRHADNPIEAEGIKRINQHITDANLILSLRTHDTPAVPLSITDNNVTLIAICNKIDLHPNSPIAPDEIAISAKSGDGMQQLHNAIARYQSHTTAATPFSARERHQHILQQCQQLIATAAQHAHTPEIAAAWLRDAQTKLNEMLGNYDEEDLLGDIFSQFCIGK